MWISKNSFLHCKTFSALSEYLIDNLTSVFSMHNLTLQKQHAPNMCKPQVSVEKHIEYRLRKISHHKATKKYNNKINWAIKKKQLRENFFVMKIEI